MVKRLAVLLVSIAVLTPSVAQSQVSASGSAFDGTVAVPERGSNSFILDGHWSLDSTSCPAYIGDFALATNYSVSPNQPAHIGVFPVDQEWTTWPYFTATFQLTGLAEGSGSVKLEFGAVEAGEYVLAVIGYYTLKHDAATYRWIPCERLSDSVLEVVDLVSVAGVTTASSASISQGQEVQISLVEVRTWSDGATTTDVATGGWYTLQARTAGQSRWKTLGRSRESASFTTKPMVQTTFRIHDADSFRYGMPVAVNVVDGRPQPAPKDPGIEWFIGELRFETDRKLVASSHFPLEWRAKARLSSYYLDSYSVRHLYLRFQHLRGVYVSAKWKPGPKCSIRLRLRGEEVGSFRLVSDRQDPWPTGGNEYRVSVYNKQGGNRIRLPDYVLEGGSFPGSISLMCSREGAVPEVWSNRVVVTVRS